MKRLILCLLSLVIMFTSVISVNAFEPPVIIDPLGPADQVEYVFRKYYKEQTDGKSVSSFKAEYCHDSMQIGIHNNKLVHFYIIQFVSEDAENNSCFNRFGENGVYYESSDVTNLVFPSGYAACVDMNIYGDSVDFISLDELVKQYPFAINHILKVLGKEHVGIMGDVDLNGELSVMDATLLQKHISEINVLTSARCKVADIDSDNEVTIFDATAIQKCVAEIDI